MISKEALLGARTPTGTAEFPIVGEDGELTTGQVSVRGMTRGEIFTMGKIGGAGKTLDTEVLVKVEAFELSCGLVDPALTYQEAQGMHASMPSAVLSPILDKIRLLSGMGDNSAKEAYKSVSE